MATSLGGCEGRFFAKGRVAISPVRERSPHFSPAWGLPRGRWWPIMGQRDAGLGGPWLSPSAELFCRLLSPSRSLPKSFTREGGGGGGARARAAGGRRRRRCRGRASSSICFLGFAFALAGRLLQGSWMHLPADAQGALRRGEAER